MPVAYGSHDRAPVSVLLTEDEDLVERTDQGICKVHWDNSTPLHGQWDAQGLAAATVAALKASQPAQGLYQQGLEADGAAALTQAPGNAALQDLTSQLLQQPCMLGIRRGALKGMDWNSTYARMDTVRDYQQAMDARRRGRLASVKQRCTLRNEHGNTRLGSLNSTGVLNTPVTFHQSTVLCTEA